MHNKLTKFIHYLIDIEEFTNNKFENELEINNTSLKFEISSVSLSESEKEIFLIFLIFLKML